MARFVGRRLVFLVAMLLGLLLLTFAISHVAPGDPASLAAGPDATPEMVEQIRQEYGLDRPLPVQLGRYLLGILQGDLGRSVRTNHDVLADLADFFPATFELVTVSILIAVLLGIPLGVLSALGRNGWFDQLARVVSVSGVAIPMFWLGLMLQLLVALDLGWLPLGGRLGLMSTPPEPITHLYLLDSLLQGQWQVFGDAAAHLLLPALALCFPALASIIRVNRAEMIEALGQDYIVTARAHGLGGFRTVCLYALKNAMLPTLAMIGLRFGWMLGGTVLVESVFDWPGIGLYATQSAIAQDFQPIMGVTLLIGISFMLANLLVDLAYVWLDPRTREPA
ncbi:peptide/nickel transport system permease protein [Tistlia consotensis]|uniref:Peptide/nickel transport system permease protein n=1 Tax=Tistlia consotensis USBA 355 TaxID=560819 RepID=A0A1Y6CM41_9PROT|nr:ABC transporter permease [Tistlia consotensis]SMF59458.1 peptide/nickel transport system permease protein [Tistlia consotensis USBA 355]SNR64345.1 peptide/nickel transport system permease protein [Tistlia consotensis]